MNAKPRSIIWFQRLFIARWLIASAVGVAYGFNLRHASEIQAMLEENHDALILGTVIRLIVSAAFAGLILYLVVRRRSAFGPIIIALWLTIIALTLIYFAVTRQLGLSPIAIFTYATYLVLALCQWLLFRPDATRWFAGTWTDPAIGEIFE